MKMFEVDFILFFSFFFLFSAFRLKLKDNLHIGIWTKFFAKCKIIWWQVFYNCVTNFLVSMADYCESEIEKYWKEYLLNSFNALSLPLSSILKPLRTRAIAESFEYFHSPELKAGHGSGHCCSSTFPQKSGWFRNAHRSILKFWYWRGRVLQK